MLAASTIERIAWYWAARLACAAADLRDNRVTVIAHGPAFRSYRGLYALRAGAGLVLSTPEAERQRVADAIAGLTPADAFDAAKLSAPFGGRVSRVVGPATIAYVDPGAFTPRHADARQLTAEDRAAVDVMQQACDPVEREHAGIDFDRAPLFGVFAGGELAAAASWSADDGVAKVGILAHPAWRGRGLACAAASAATSELLRRGMLPQWQTLVANEPAVAIGRSLGYVEWSLSLALRLAPEP
jgi:hypothetical protein